MGEKTANMKNRKLMKNTTNYSRTKKKEHENGKIQRENEGSKHINTKKRELFTSCSLRYSSHFMSSSIAATKQGGMSVAHIVRS